MSTATTGPASPPDLVPSVSVNAPAGGHAGLTWYGLAARFLDLLVIVASLALAEWTRTASSLGRPIPAGKVDVDGPVTVIALGLWIVASATLGLYRIDRTIRPLEQCLRALGVLAVVAALFAGALYLTFRDVSRLLFGYFFVFSAGGVLGVRLLLLVLVHWFQPDEQRVAVVGTGPVARTLAQSLRSARWAIPRIRLIGFFRAGESQDEGPWREPEPVLGEAPDAEALERLILEHQVREVLIALPPGNTQRSSELVARLRELGVAVRLVPDVIELAATRARVENLGGIPVIYLRDPTVLAVEQVAKRALDIGLSASMLVLLSPFMALAALAIRVESTGPIFYRARRVGQDGRLFTMYKFRTMVADADRQPTQAPEEQADPDAVYKQPGDPRVTGFGRLLRRTSFDETPQFFNVLRGDMSLVGPRPEQPFIVEAYRPWQRRRLEVRPGMTGWWQVAGRDLPMHRHTEYDLYYLYNYSLGLDVKILARTLWAVIHGRGAY